MKNQSSLIYSLALLVGDFLMIVAAFVIAYILRVTFDPRPLVDQIPAFTFLQIFLLLLPFWLIIFATLGLYNKEVYEKRPSEWGRLLIGTFIGILFIIGFDFISNEPIFPARLVPIYGWALGFGLLVVERSFLRWLRSKLFEYNIGINRLLLIGSSPATKKIAQLLGETHTSGYKIVGIVGQKNLVPKDLDVKHYSTPELALNNLKKLNVHTIVQTQLFDNDTRNQRILEAAQANHIAYKFIPGNDVLYTANNRVELFHDFLVMSVHQTPLIGWGRIVKRVFDLFVSSAIIMLTAPIMLLIAVAIKLSDLKAPVLFKQKRLTRFGSKVTIYKFRSMHQKYSSVGPEAAFKTMGREDLLEEFLSNRGKVSNDPRVTRIGKFLRRTSLDELPQLFNVIKGDLSLVGPRAIPEDELKDVRDKTPLILSVKTGITGLAQVSGRSNISFEERIKLDLYYVQNWSFWMDIVILLKTIRVVIRGTDSI